MPKPTHPPGAKTHWVARVNHRNRSGGFAMLLVIVGLHMLQQDHGLGAWVALVAQFAVYPQVAFWFAKRAADPFAAEIRHMKLDALSLGVWIAVLHFPLWISFAMLTGASLNLTLYRGARGWVEAVGLLVAGSALASLITGWSLQPQTDPLVTALVIVALLIYLFSVSLDSQQRAMRLRETRQEMHTKERALQAQLAEIQSLQAELNDQARHDTLTGLFNRRHLNDIMGRELARCAREGLPLSLLLMDIDHFKRVNDTLGHQAGDTALRETARLLTQRTRASDLLFRWGGEEFLMVLTGADATSAKEPAEALRVHYAQSPLAPGHPPLQATLSVGVACCPDHGETFDQLMQAADQAMYRAKNAGRNRVEIA